MSTMTSLTTLNKHEWGGCAALHFVVCLKCGVVSTNRSLKRDCVGHKDAIAKAKGGTL